MSTAEWSDSLWKSLAVKSLRMGWPGGLQATADHLGQSNMRQILLCGLWEDVFPAVQDVDMVTGWIKTYDYEALCGYATHHSRPGLTDAFCDLEYDAVAVAKYRTNWPELWEQGKALGVWLPTRSLNCFWTWLQLQPTVGGIRSVDGTGWKGMPAAAADMHTKEGKRMGTPVTVLSGTYDQHRAIAHRVLAEGWDGIRDEVHNETLT